MNNRKKYDISIILGKEDVAFPGDTRFRKEFVTSHEHGDMWNVSKLEMSAHSGTHIDVPYHLIGWGKSIEQIPVDSFILNALVLSVDNKRAVHSSTVETADIKPGEAILFKTRNSSDGIVTGGNLSEEYIYITGQSAEICVRKQAALVGIDCSSVDKTDSEDYPVHNILLKNGIFILENINLREVPEGKYTLICLPLKLSGGEASPVRAVLVEN